MSLKRTEEQRLIVACDGSVEGGVGSWVSRVMGGWPGRLERPGVVAMDVLELRALLRAAPNHDDGTTGRDTLHARVLDPLADGALVVMGPAVARTHVYQIADLLDRTLTPCVVVLSGRGDGEVEELARGVLDGHGLLVEPEGVGGVELAATLSALMRRQPLVKRVAAELRLGHIGQGRIHEELARVDRELHEAARLQRALVRCCPPQMPEVGLGVVYRPAGQVSGDIYDVERVDERHVGIFVADAVGHGVPAGMLTLFISRALPRVDRVGWKGQRVVPPGEAMGRLNAMYCERVGNGAKFSTAAYVLLDVERMVGRLTLAGHPAPVVVRRGGALERPDAGGPLLGVFPGAEYGECEVDLSDGASLVLFTDGFEMVYEGQLEKTRGQIGGRTPHIDRLAALGEAATGVCGEEEGMRGAIGSFEGELNTQIGSLHPPDDLTALVVTPRVGGVAVGEGLTRAA